MSKAIAFWSMLWWCMIRQRRFPMMVHGWTTTTTTTIGSGGWSPQRTNKDPLLVPYYYYYSMLPTTLTTTTSTTRLYEHRQMEDDPGRWISQRRQRTTTTTTTTNTNEKEEDAKEWVTRGTVQNDPDGFGGGGVANGWDDFDPLHSPSDYTNGRRSRIRRDEASRHGSRPGGGGGGRRRRPSPRSTSSSRSPTNTRKGTTKWTNKNDSQQQQQQQQQERKINMKALEGAGLEHLYGLSPVLNALVANRREFTQPPPNNVMDWDNDNDDDNDDNDDGYQQQQQQQYEQSPQRKPQAQFSPWLFVQEQKGSGGGRGRGRGGGRSYDKVQQAERIQELAQERGIPIAHVDKGVLNTLSGNRPHQGVVLRCGKLDFTPLSRVPLPGGTGNDGLLEVTPNLWLVLDEVVDPQNLGALLRSAFFLGGLDTIGVLVCERNSSPLSPTVSAASAGALELLNVYSTTNLPRTLAAAEEDGFRIVGASSTIKDLDIPVYDLTDLPSSKEPTLLLLGSEGHGLRHLVAKSCTAFVRIPGAGDIQGVDSLNVSVTGAIILHELLRQSR